MATPTTVYISPQRRQRLFQRARRRKTSFSGELRAAVDFYLDLPPDFDQRDFTAVVQEAHESLQRSMQRLDAMSERVRQTSLKLNAIDRRLNALT